MDGVEQIHVALRGLVEQRKRRKEAGRAASDREEEEEDRVLSSLLAQLDSLKGLSSSSSSQSVELDRNIEDEANENKETGADEIAARLKKMERQNTVTHGLLSFLIIVTAAWQLSEVSVLLRLRDKLTHPFRGAGKTIKGVLRRGGLLQNIQGLAPSPNGQFLEMSPFGTPLSVPELPHVDLPSLPSTGEQE